MRLLLAMLLLTGLSREAALAQQSGANSPAPYIADDEIAMTFNKLSQRALRMIPMLEQLRPNDWVAKGAPDAYTTQWNSVIQQFRAIETDMTALAQHPGKLTDTMKALFRLDATHPVLESLLGGTRKYQNPALADLIESVVSENTSDVDRVERYLLQLAADQEQQFAVVDREAQRCRATLSRQPAEPARNNRKSQ